MMQCFQANAMWPATAIESAVTQQMRVPKAVMRSPHIFADACVALSELDPASAPRVRSAGGGGTLLCCLWRVLMFGASTGGGVVG